MLPKLAVENEFNMVKLSTTFPQAIFMVASLEEINCGREFN